MISQGSFRIIAKQRYVMVNEAKLEWDEVNILQILGHRVGVGEDMLAVTFRKRNITLVIRRHVATPTDEIDYEEVDNEEAKNVPPISGRENGSEENTGNTGEPRGGFSGVNEGYDRANILPVIGFEERDSIVNRVMSSKRRRGLILQNFLGINQDQTFVRNLIVEVDGHGRKKREATSEAETTQGGVVNFGNNVHKGSRTEGEEFNNKKTQERREEVIVQDEKWHFMVNRNQGSDAQTRLLVETDSFPGSLVDDVPKNHQRRRHVPSQRKRHERTSGRKQRDVDEDYTLDDTTLPEGEKRKGQTVFLGLYIADARDLSNKTHGLLGQFLFKNVSLEKITYRNGRMKARLLINGNPSRRTIAFVTLRRNLALNATRACWKIRQQGRDVIDGNYSNYLVSNIRYSNLKDLPPPL
ncbi:unnamed protein product [Lymnaea stagnalis]|uniref:Inter-alpha-trypsin inhibitor heavy chain C-terminal domain-containing protein n=1 Tax=Lymnaea stagnalis TaxID=6523 RepID=A0AAV2HFP0_LYMST